MKNLVILLMSVIGISQSAAQDYEYVPFVREGVKWVYYYDNNGDWLTYDYYFAPGKNYFILEIKGDTVIDGKAYKAMHKYHIHKNAIDHVNDTVPIYLREEDKVVYGITPKENQYPDCLPGYGPMLGALPTIFKQVVWGNEFVLYNFKDTEVYYDSIFSSAEDYNYYKYLVCDTISLGERLAQRHASYLFPKGCYLIEGVGYDGFRAGYTISYMWSDYDEGPRYFLSHVIENGEVIYEGVHFDSSRWEHDGIDEVVAEQPPRPLDNNYYNLMGRPVGKDVPTAPGIYIHHGQKICVSRTR